MMLKELNTLLETIKDEYGYDYEYLGIRTQDQPYSLGAIDHCSRIWADGEETEDELNGISATNIDSRYIKMHCDDAGYNLYYGAHCAIIAGNHAELGEDPGELVISDPTVIYIIR